MFHTAAAKVLAAAPPNPLDGVTPNLDAFGATARGKITIVLGAIWMVVILVCAAYFLLGIASYGRAKKAGMHDDLGAGAERMKTAGMAFGCAVAAPMLLGAVIFVAS